MAQQQKRTRRQTSRTDQQAASDGTPRREVVQTWAFDSVGTRKYALQIARASNGNPCLRVVEGVPNDEGGYRRFEIVFWSEDFDRLFETLDEVRQYITEHEIRTPEGHSWQPSSNRRGPGKQDPQRRSAGPEPTDADAAKSGDSHR